MSSTMTATLSVADDRFDGEPGDDSHDGEDAEHEPASELRRRRRSVGLDRTDVLPGHRLAGPG